MATAGPDDGGCFHGNGVLRSWSRCLCGSTPARRPELWWPLLSPWCLSATRGSHGGPALAARKTSACLAEEKRTKIVNVSDQLWQCSPNRPPRSYHTASQPRWSLPAFRLFHWPLQQFITKLSAPLLSWFESTSSLRLLTGRLLLEGQNNSDFYIIEYNSSSQ